MRIGNFETTNDVFLAPMAGVSDRIFRDICEEHGCGLTYSEMISAKGFYYGSEKTIDMIDIGSKRAAVQIFGSDPDIMAEAAAKISLDERVVLIDINMGCPVVKIVKNLEGSALMKNGNLAGKIVEKVVLSSKKPVTVKIRKGFDKENINAVEFAKRLEASGAYAVAVHGRTREQMYEGKADLDIIKDVKEALKIPVIGNGDITSPREAKFMFDYTGCDAVMIGRGALGNPWIFEETLHFLKNGELLPEPSIYERINTAIMHLDRAYIKYKERGIVEMRKHLAWYLKGLKNSSSIRDIINQMKNIDEIKELLIKYRDSL